MHQQLRAIATVLSLINPAILFARAVAGHSLARPHFFAIQIIFFILIAMYCTVRELVRVIGREKALRIFFGPMPAPEV